MKEGSGYQSQEFTNKSSHVHTQHVYMIYGNILCNTQISSRLVVMTKKGS